MDTQGGTMKKFLSKAASVAGLTAAFIQGGITQPTVSAGDSCCGTVGDCGVDCSQPMHFGSGCCPTDGCAPWYAHRSGAYGEFLYLSRATRTFSMLANKPTLNHRELAVQRGRWESSTLMNRLVIALV